MGMAINAENWKNTHTWRNKIKNKATHIKNWQTKQQYNISQVWKLWIKFQHQMTLRWKYIQNRTRNIWRDILHNVQQQQTIHMGDYEIAYGNKHQWEVN